MRLWALAALLWGAVAATLLGAAALAGDPACISDDSVPVCRNAAGR